MNGLWFGALIYWDLMFCLCFVFLHSLLELFDDLFLLVARTLSLSTYSTTIERIS